MSDISIEELIKRQSIMIKERTAAFIAARAEQELQVKKWGEDLKQVDPQLLGDIQLPAEITLHALVPELYAEEPRKAVYEEQLKKLNEFIESINQLAYKQYKEAQGCLSA